MVRWVGCVGLGWVALGWVDLCSGLIRERERVGGSVGHYTTLHYTTFHDPSVPASELGGFAQEGEEREPGFEAHEEGLSGEGALDGGGGGGGGGGGEAFVSLGFESPEDPGPGPRAEEREEPDVRERGGVFV